MKRNSFISRFRLALATALRYWCGYAAALEALNKVYIKEWPDEQTDGHFSIKIRIISCGGIYHVAQSFYFNDSYIKDVSWLATYSWQTTGCLVSIGVIRDLIFDPVQKLLYLEETTGSGEVTVEIYNQIQIKKV
jgi:hypothetical protein